MRDGAYGVAGRSPWLIVGGQKAFAIALVRIPHSGDGFRLAFGAVAEVGMLTGRLVETPDTSEMDAITTGHQIIGANPSQTFV